jgi:hypothetical protein
VSEKSDADTALKVRAAPLRTCNRCGAVLIQSRSMLNSRTGKTVRIDKCQCGELIWSEDR